MGGAAQLSSSTVDFGVPYPGYLILLGVPRWNLGCPGDLGDLGTKPAKDVGHIQRHGFNARYPWRITNSVEAQLLTSSLEAQLRGRKLVNSSRARSSLGDLAPLPSADLGIISSSQTLVATRRLYGAMVQHLPVDCQKGI